MQYFKIDLNTGTILDRADDFTDAWREEVRASLNDDQSNLTALMRPYITLDDCPTREIADHMAEQLNDEAGKEIYLGVDRGAHIFPRYSVVVAPQIGDKVSYAFNGDSRPCGEIKSISATLKRITTTDGRTFYRRGESASWISNRTWSLVQGHVEKRNLEL